MLKGNKKMSNVGKYIDIFKTVLRAVLMLLDVLSLSGFGRNSDNDTPEIPPKAHV